MSKSVGYPSIHFDTDSFGIDNVIEAIILTIVRYGHTYLATHRTLVPLAAKEVLPG